MSLAAGTRLGPFEILSPLGAGGMGEVYRARDARLGREIAIKVLPDAFAANPDRLRRFEREARAASAISDPHIVAVFDIGNENGVSFLATELVDGSDLRTMLGSPLPVRKAIELAEQIAGGLAAAHEKGIVHRDLKPENVLVARSGLAKVADFGLARFAETPDAERSRMPTESRVETSEGVVLGTVSYMSPEQAAGRRVDHRSDQFAFGLILYEMLTGRTAFRRETAAETLAAILRDELEPVSRAHPSVPGPLSWIVERCLAKDPDGRYASTRDLARELSNVKTHLSDIAQVPTAAPRAITAGKARERLGWGLAVVLSAVAAAAIVRARRAPAFGGTIRSSIELSGDSGLRSAALSPDGTILAFVARDASGRSLLAVRSIDALDARPLSGTENASDAFWSPDGRAIGFFADGKLKRVDLAGGPTEVITDAPLGRGASWNREGVILFSPVANGPLYRVSAAGGAPARETQLDPSRGETSHRWPVFLPDGKHYLFDVASWSGSGGGKMGIYAGALGSRVERFLVAADASPAFVPVSAGRSEGHLLFVRDRELYAQPFDASKLRLTGEPRSVGESIEYFPETQGAVYTASANGLLAYGSRSTPRFSQLTWVDRSGRKLGVLGEPGNASNPRISPDGRRVTLDLVDSRTDNRDVWLYDSAGGLPSRLTSDPSLDANPIWSSDGTRIMFMSLRHGHPDLYEMNSNGAGNDEPVLLSEETKFPTDWSPDGRRVLYTSLGERTNFEIWSLELGANGRPVPYLRAPYGVTQGQFAPDGKRVAYASNESGRWEIEVASFPGPGGKWRVSAAGGSEPRWRRDGREIFYLAPDGRLMAVAVKNDPDFEASPAQPLFAVHRPERISSTDFYCYDVSADGQRFLVNVDAGDTVASSLTLVLNWMAGLRP